MEYKNAPVKRQGTVYEYFSLIESISKQEYFYLNDYGVSFQKIVNYAAIAVRIAVLSGRPLNANLVSCLIRRTIRLAFEEYYTV